jgi:uncharacterized integral membrane protein
MALPQPLLKAWIWTKIVLLALVVLYTMLFAFKNSDEDITLWLFVAREPTVNVLVALLGAFALGALVTALLRTVISTVRQMRTARDRNRTLRLEREIADMRTKAATLRTREAE